MTTETGDGAAATRASDFAGAWRELHADGDLQFAPLKLPEQPPPPEWWVRFLEWLAKLFKPVGEFLGGLGQLIGVSGQVLLWGLIALAMALAALLVWRVFGDARLARRGAAEKPADWTPEQGEALALLEDADRLAASGRYDEATHLLLKRSVGQIAAARPGLLEPSSTAREISQLPALSDRARGAFGTIATRVERSLFALRSLTLDDWQAARAAYADFALAPPLAA